MRRTGWVGDSFWWSFGSLKLWDQMLRAFDAVREEARDQ